MKTRSYFLKFVILLGVFNFINAQSSDGSNGINQINPIYDYLGQKISNTATIPDFQSKSDQLKITGTIYKSDGVTPAKNVVLYIEQADEHGDFDLRNEKENRYVYNRAWIKTNEDGKYTFYTYVPGNDRRFNQFQQIFPVVIDENQNTYEIGTYLFDQDPLLSRACRKKIAKKDDPTRILKLQKVESLFTAKRDIVLPENIGKEKVASK
ncbi:peptidase associated/transthyretin-like domain-containing protein [Winogradskyella ursingii]|uniref:hypothetical protein n=1 Tax=Winogradskyella ursingii TaxID=2686079 RepID=UPI0015C8B130|nr:hypothetical protein [Winogradskyella ursingii]